MTHHRTQPPSRDEARLRVYVQGYLDSQRNSQCRPSTSGDRRFTAQQMRALLIENAIACLDGERSEAFVIELARQLDPEAARTNDVRLHGILNRLASLEPGETVHGLSIARLLQAVEDALT